MANKIIYINFNNSTLIDDMGGVLTTRPSISYQSNPSWELRFVTFDETDGSLIPADLSSGVAWHCAVDIDFDSTSLPMIRTLDDGIDHSRAKDGIIVVSLDANTETFFDKINNRDSVNAYFELRGNDTNNKVIYDIRFKILTLGAIDPQGGDPLPIVSGGVTLPDVYSLLRKAPEYEWSSDSVNWHKDQLAEDTYYRTRYEGGVWSAGIQLANGRDGYNIKFQYSTTGEDWHYLPTDEDWFMRTSNDDGATWTESLKYRGNNGIGYKAAGAFDEATTYNPKGFSNAYDLVTYNGGSYIYIGETATAGNIPPIETDANEFWQLLAKKGDTGSITSISVTNISDIDTYMSENLSGYYTKEEIDNKYGSISLSNLYNKDQIDLMMASKMPADGTYSRGQIDNFLNGKIDRYYTYSKQEINDRLTNYVPLNKHVQDIEKLDSKIAGFVSTEKYENDYQSINNSVREMTLEVQSKLSKSSLEDLGTVTDSFTYDYSTGDYKIATIGENSQCVIGASSFIGFNPADVGALQITKTAGSQLVMNGKAVLDSNQVGTFLIGLICTEVGSLKMTTPTLLI